MVPPLPMNATVAVDAHRDAGASLVHDPALGSLPGGSSPVVHTLHGPWTEPARHFYSLVHEHVGLVAISETQRADNPGLHYAATVHNGIDLEAYPFLEHKDEFLIYIGR